MVYLSFRTTWGDGERTQDLPWHAQRIAATSVIDLCDRIPARFDFVRTDKRGVLEPTTAGLRSVRCCGSKTFERLTGSDGSANPQGSLLSLGLGSFVRSVPSKQARTTAASSAVTEGVTPGPF